MVHYWIISKLNLGLKQLQNLSHNVINLVCGFTQKLCHFPALWSIMFYCSCLNSTSPPTENLIFQAPQNATSSIKLFSIKDFSLFTFPYSILNLSTIRITCYYLSDLTVFYLCLSYSTYSILIGIINLFTCLCSLQIINFLRSQTVSPLEPTAFNIVFCTQLVYTNSITSWRFKEGGLQKLLLSFLQGSKD